MRAVGGTLDKHVIGGLDSCGLLHDVWGTQPQSDAKVGGCCLRHAFE